jgi:hypothetical protein
LLAKFALTAIGGKTIKPQIFSCKNSLPSTFSV